MTQASAARKKLDPRSAYRLLSADLFRVLADPNRIALVKSLLENGSTQSVSEHAPCCPVDFSVVSRHLTVLREAGLVEATRQGKRVLYRINTGEVAAMLRQLADALDSCCGPKASRTRGKAPRRSAKVSS